MVRRALSLTPILPGDTREPIGDNVLIVKINRETMHTRQSCVVEQKWLVGGNSLAARPARTL